MTCAMHGWHRIDWTGENTHCTVLYRTVRNDTFP